MTSEIDQLWQEIAKLNARVTELEAKIITYKYIGKIPPRTVPVDDLVAEFESTPPGVKGIAEGRKWVAATFYGDTARGQNKG